MELREIDEFHKIQMNIFDKNLDIFDVCKY